MNNRAKQTKLLALLSKVFFSIPAFLQIWWIISFSLTKSHKESKELYFSVIPNFLQENFILTKTSIICCILAIVLSIAYKMKSKQSETSTVIIILSTIILLLNVFSLL